MPYVYSRNRNLNFNVMRFITSADYQELKTKFKITIEKKYSYEGDSKEARAEFAALFLLTGGYNPIRAMLKSSNEEIINSKKLEKLRIEFLNIIYEMEQEIILNIN